MPQLSDLIAALETAGGPSRELDEWMAVEVFGLEQGPSGYWGLRDPVTTNMICYPLPAYTSSLDAITGACEQRWPLVWRVTSDGATSTAELNAVPVRRVITAEADTPALALCLAAARLAAAEAADAPAPR